MSSTNSGADPHAFQPPAPNAARSPCPALNALSAHGYIPRSGRDISFLQFFKAIRAVYNTSPALTILLTCGGFFLCGHNARPTIPFLGKVDLNDFALHGGVEHDASLAHGDTAAGERYAPTTPDKALLEELLDEAHGRGYLDLADIARVRSRREFALTLHGKGLDSLHAEIARGEISLILSLIGDGEKVSTKNLREWMYEERLPDGWKRPEKSVGLIDTVKKARKIAVVINKEKEAIQVGKKDQALL